MIFFAIVSGVLFMAPGFERSRCCTASKALASTVDYDGSTIVSMSSEFQPGLIYKKFPSDEPIVPSQSWQLSFGVVLASQAASIPVTLRLVNAQQDPAIQIVIDSTVFVPQDGLYNNFDPLERFEIEYTGALNPYMGPIDFVLAPDGFPDVPVRVHLNVTDQPGFPLPFSRATAVVGNITGDEALEIIIPGRLGEFPIPEGLHAFDTAGSPVPGWPIFTGEPGPDSGGFRTPTIVDLDGDGHDEVVAVGIFFDQNVSNRGTNAGTGFSTSLYVVEGSGQIRWQATAADLEDSSVPAVGDLDGDGDLDIITSTLTNLTRFEADGTRVAGWQVETLNDIFTYSHTVIGDLDGNSANGKEIAACALTFGPNTPDQVYVWHQDGSLRGPMWPKVMHTCVAPIIVDLDGNPSNGLEIVMPLDFFEDPPVDPKTGFLNTFTVFAWHGDGSDVSGWPHRFLRDPIVWVDDRITFASAADLDGNGYMEVVVGTYGIGEPSNGNLFVFHHDGTLDPNWPQWGGIAQIGGAALADLDGDGLLDIVTGSFHGVFAFRANGQPFEGFPRKTSDNLSHAAIADLDRDGKLEIVQSSLLGRLHTWQLLTPTLDRVAWPQFRQNPAHTGTRVDGRIEPIPSASAAGLAVMGCLLVCASIIMIRRRESHVPDAPN